MKAAKYALYKINYEKENTFNLSGDITTQQQELWFYFKILMLNFHAKIFKIKSQWRHISR